MGSMVRLRPGLMNVGRIVGVPMNSTLSKKSERHEIALEPHWRPKLTGASYMDCN
ncbi:BQ5605_C011g06547 [Microbotryum silenes-dioicae]|uniref:BQ5605_C011g06547 protein n=1 Tax=Microbotryum silenes-dioicae TaxID=796604 RepID=A0A2X0MIK2_9BASI|nr:BQ5605_C011g06547 [Microbotryum silenes-dioicae]